VNLNKLILEPDLFYEIDEKVMRDDKGEKWV
jgi:hypothetical protein